MRAYRFGDKGIRPTKLRHVACREANLTTRVQISAGSQKLGKAENVQKIGAISDIRVGCK